MRLVATFQNSQEAASCAAYLNRNGIEASCEPDGHQVQVWIVEEDQLEEAEHLLTQFRQSPRESRMRPPPKPGGQAARRKPPSMGPATTVLLIGCVLAFLFTGFSAAGLRQLPPYLPPFFGLNSPLASGMLFDFPHHFELEQQIIDQLTPAQLQMETPPPTVVPLVAQMRATPYWQGAYDEFLLRTQHPQLGWQVTAPLFEKLREGQFWRLISPIFLHANLLHIFFNMLWLVVVGSQVERRIGVGKYLLLTLLGAVIPNTAQYLMGGPFFLGYSGVITTLVGYVWARQKVAPWEGYLLARATLWFVGVYVVGLFLLQLTAFIVALTGTSWLLATGMANTAHLTGAAVGYLIGRKNWLTGN